MIYNYHCKKCNIRFDEITTLKDRDRIKCARCGNIANRKFSPTAIPYKEFPTGYWHNIDSKPIFIKSASHLAEECIKRWTPSNKMWPEMLDGFSTPGVPNDVKYDGAENHPSKEELCQKKERRLKEMVERAQEKERKSPVTILPKSQSL